MCNLPIAASTPCSVVAHDLLEQETSIYFTSTLLEETETSTKGMKWEEPIDHLNSFLRSRDVSPIRYTLKTPWNDAREGPDDCMSAKPSKRFQLFLVK